MIVGVCCVVLWCRSEEVRGKRVLVVVVVVLERLVFRGGGACEAFGARRRQRRFEVWFLWLEGGLERACGSGGVGPLLAYRREGGSCG